MAALIVGCGSTTTKTISPGSTESLIRETVWHLGRGFPDGPIACPARIRLTAGATIGCSVVLRDSRTLAETYARLVLHVTSGNKLVYHEQDLEIDRVLRGYVGFATVIPPGFKDASGDLPVDVFSLPGPESPDLEADVGPRGGGVPAAIALVRVNAGPDTSIGDVETAIKREDRSAHRFSPSRSLTVAGEPAESFDYFTSGALRASPPTRVTVHRLAIVVMHQGTLYVVGYSAAPSAYAAHIDAVSRLIRAWRWT